MVWAAAAVVATERTARAGHAGRIVAAALALPGAVAAQADPGSGLIAFRWLEYRDAQPGLDRIRVHAPSLALQLPVGSDWGIEATSTADRVSGASPRWHSAISSASRMEDRRLAGDVKLTRYLERSAWSLGVASSDEDDFASKALSIGARWDSEDNNRSWTMALAATRDQIGSSDNPLLDERRRTWEATAGVTQAWTRRDLVQITLTRAQGHGFYSDPYKRIDQRPRERNQTILTLRWNHHLDGPDLALRTHYRSYVDSWAVRSHTLALEGVWQATSRVALTPSIRLYSQSAARFYYDPVYSFVGAPLPPGFLESPPAVLSADHRLSAFGAVTLGLKVAARLGDVWTVDLKFERYEQRGTWRIGGAGSPGLAPFSARFVQWGLARTF